jgi:hypothetical protein
MTLEDLIADINEQGWLLHSLSQFRYGDLRTWSATVRRDGPNRQPISRGRGTNMQSAIADAFGGIAFAKLEPETTAYAEPVEPPMSLANLLPIPPLGPTIRRR